MFRLRLKCQKIRKVEIFILKISKLMFCKHPTLWGYFELCKLFIRLSIWFLNESLKKRSTNPLIEGTTHLFLHDMRQFLLQIKGMMEENVLTEEIEIQKVLKMILLGLKKELYLDLHGEVHP